MHFSLPCPCRSRGNAYKCAVLFFEPLNCFGSVRKRDAGQQSKISSHCGPENEFFFLSLGGGGDMLTMAVAVSLLHSFY
jgi:hypothetical protein